MSSLLAGHTRTSLLRSLNSSVRDDWMLPESRERFNHQWRRQQQPDESGLLSSQCRFGISFTVMNNKQNQHNQSENETRLNTVLSFSFRRRTTEHEKESKEQEIGRVRVCFLVFL